MCLYFVDLEYQEFADSIIVTFFFGTRVGIITCLSTQPYGYSYDNPTRHVPCTCCFVWFLILQPAYCIFIILRNKFISLILILNKTLSIPIILNLPLLCNKRSVLSKIRLIRFANAFLLKLRIYQLNALYRSKRNG